MAPTAERPWRHPEFRQGVHDMAEVALGVGAWGLITGVTMVKAGLSVPLALAMSLLVYAGSAQLTALPLMAGGAPMWLVWAAAACVNLRFVIFSAGWRSHFGHLSRARRLWLTYFAVDLNYVVFARRFPRREPGPGQEPYFWGGALVVWVGWQLPSVLGIVLAPYIPTGWGLGFAGTLALLAISCGMLTDRATGLGAAAAGCAAVAAYALPLKLNIVVAIAAAVSVGLLADHRWARGRSLP
ncbi:MAG: AzlC family ABC transporter permease [Rubrivivax sp.]|nr:AzlC family ABC transporter permease [Rubrivivax sp.]MDH5338372.1 AzlC family ABC transporter permease [Rubrivivax sp.]